jgi:hypothetical protein
MPIQSKSEKKPYSSGKTKGASKANLSDLRDSPEHLLPMAEQRTGFSNREIPFPKKNYPGNYQEAS